MNTSLTEMVLAIAIAAIVLAMVAVPTTKMVIAEQKLEARMRDVQTQRLAAVRLERIGQHIWRTDQPPTGYARPHWLARTGMFVGDHLVAGWTPTMYSYRNGAVFTPLAHGIDRFAMGFRLTNGSETSVVQKTAFDQLVAARYQWQSGPFTFSGWSVPLDRAFDASPLALPAADTSKPYSRSAWSRTLSFDLGTWR